VPRLRLSPVAGLPALHIVLVNPRIPLATKDVFAALGPIRPQPLPELTTVRNAADLVGWLGTTRNDLAEAATRLVPDIAIVLAALEEDPDCLFARMSGSGPTCFGLFASAAQAEKSAARLRQKRSDWWIAATLAGA
jgi:4-diphosphocytidyl-2-C-methyl-D-erythritol kinase